MPSQNPLLCFSRRSQNDPWRMSLTYYGSARYIQSRTLLLFKDGSPIQASSRRKWLSTESISEREDSSLLRTLEKERSFSLFLLISASVLIMWGPMVRLVK
ncbi:hypothetical protein Bca4012_051633 [Brassica carinata]